MARYLLPWEHLKSRPRVKIGLGISRETERKETSEAPDVWAGWYLLRTNWYLLSPPDARLAFLVGCFLSVKEAWWVRRLAQKDPTEIYYSLTWQLFRRCLGALVPLE